MSHASRATSLATYVPSSLPTPPGRSRFDSVDEYAAAFAAWLRDMTVERSWFATLTYQRSKRRLSFERASHDLRAWARQVSHDAFTSCRAKRRGVPWVGAIEPQADGTPHVHAILTKCSHLDPRAVEAHWAHGRSLVEPYDEERAGCEYLVKSIANGAYLDIATAFTRGL